jgi:hypothetical protein
MTTQTKQPDYSLLGLADRAAVLFSRVQRNHGLEHATLHILARRFPHQAMAGYSDTGGFWLVGDIPSDEVEAAVREALARMRAGESGLAVHPNCGTNFATSGILAGLAAGLAVMGAGPRLRDKLERLPLAATLATLALIISQPLGLFLQARYTTSGVPGNLEVALIRRRRRGNVSAHRVQTQG